MQDMVVVPFSSTESAVFGPNFASPPDSGLSPFTTVAKSPTAAPTERFAVVPEFADRVMTVTVLGILSVGLISTVLDGSWSNGLDLKRIGPILSTGIASMAMLVMWLAFQRWRVDGSAFPSRLAIAIPCLAWASQSISAPVLFSESTARQVPSPVRIGAGVVGIFLIACDVVRPHWTLVRTFAGRLGACVAAVVGVALAISVGLTAHPALQVSVRLSWATTCMPASLGILGIALLVSPGSSETVLRRVVGGSACFQIGRAHV